MRTNDSLFDVDFLIQQSGHSNVDIYHGTMYLDNSADGYYASGDIVNGLTGDKGTLKIADSAGYYAKCNLNITLEHYDPVKDINDITSIDKTFLMCMLNGIDATFLIDERSLLLMDPARVKASNEPTMAVLIYDKGGSGVNMVRDIFYQDEDVNPWENIPISR